MPNTIKSDELKKGDVVFMRGTNWRATIADNKRGGTIRMATVEGVYTETGSVYVHDIAYAVKDGQRVEIELTPKQVQCRDMNARIFG